jgi:uncharacterized protein
MLYPERMFPIMIETMTKQACIALLQHTRLGRIACAHDGQPYVTPLSFACQDDHIYAFSTAGQKSTWMRANPLVCLEADEIVNRYNWATVVVIGKYEELTDTPEYADLRNLAYELIKQEPLWWEPGYVETVLDSGQRPLGPPVYFRIHMDRITGHHGIPDTKPS